MLPIALIAKFSKPLLLLALVAGMIGYRALLIRERDQARAQVTALTAERTELQAANSSMRDAIARQNAAIDTLCAAAGAAEQAAQQRENGAASHGAEVLQAEITRAAVIGRTAVPDGCAGAIGWGNAQGPELGRW
jgi:hypothetical protein